MSSERSVPGSFKERAKKGLIGAGAGLGIFIGGVALAAEKGVLTDDFSSVAIMITIGTGALITIFAPIYELNELAVELKDRGQKSKTPPAFSPPSTVANEVFNYELLTKLSREFSIYQNISLEKENYKLRYTSQS